MVGNCNLRELLASTNAAIREIAKQTRERRNVAAALADALIIVARNERLSEFKNDDALAAAPEMARVLLRLLEPAYPPTIRDDDGYVEEIKAALRKAGRLPQHTP